MPTSRGDPNGGAKTCRRNPGTRPGGSALVIAISPRMVQVFLDDEDAVEDKLSVYYECIVEG